MLAMELLCGQATAPSTTFTALTMAAGNSLTVRAAVPGSKVHLLSAFADNQAAGTLRIRSPQLHDNVQGIRSSVVASEVYPLLSPYLRQMLQPQDTLVAELTGSATAGDIEGAALLLFYEDLPGINGRFMSLADLAGRVRNIVNVENTLALGTTGGYSGEEAINAEFDLLRANTDYALIGYLVSAECLAVRWRGVDTGNLGVGGPGNDTNRLVTSRWFVDLAQKTGLPCIPVFNSANRAGILVDGVQDENGTDVTVTSMFAELAPA